MRFYLLILLLSQLALGEEIPTLHFDGRLTWKQIFDDGFRPKHLEGLESVKCVCRDQSFFLKFKDRETKFKVEEGRLAFSFSYGDVVQMLWHQGKEAITLEEGRRRADEFRKVFDGYITQEITMPPLIDPSGLVDAGRDEHNVKAQVGEYRISYGFDNSMRKDKPIIPHFYISWSFSGKPDVRRKDPDDVVRPPEGYEWYDLSPKSSPKPEIDVQETKKPAPQQVPPIAQSPVQVEAESHDRSWIWILILSCGLLVVIAIMIRKNS